MAKTKMMRPAVAMLELIFAIVIMAIILMSAPQLISTAAKSGYVAIQQEAINEAASHINMIMGYHWDESDTNESYVDPILRVDSITAGLVEAVPTGRRMGTPEESYRSFIRSDGNSTLSASTISIDTGETGNYDEDDMDDFEDDRSIIKIEDSDADYVEKSATININTTVRYISDSATYNASSFSFSPDFISTGSTAAANSTNIKRITVTLTSSGPEELAKEVILHGFSCNIGGTQLEERNF